MGAEQPFAGRLRFSSELRYHWDRVGDVETHEAQLAVAGSWSPTDWLTLSASMPLVVRDVRFANLSRATVVGPGDADVRGRAVLLKDRPFAPSHMLGLSAGVKLPTSVDQLGPGGALLPYDAQTGSGTVDPLAGLFYAHFADPWSVFASASVALPLAPRFIEAPGPSLRTSLAVQYRADDWITVRGAIDTRLDAPARVGEGTDPSTDQLVVFLSPDLLWSPRTDMTLVLGLRVPLVQITERARAEGLYVIGSVVVDVGS